jgi:O-acetyl-ADP-ribose deacetylase (regulator of RNase III)
MELTALQVTEMTIEYRKGNLFDAPSGVALVQANNARGVTGAGISAEFKKRFPYTEEGYREACQMTNMIGQIIIGTEKNYHVVYLVTSRGYGMRADQEDQILKNTKLCVQSLLESLPKEEEIHSPMINAGLFRVQWEKTAKVIEEEIAKTGHKWIVWQL